MTNDLLRWRATGTNYRGITMQQVPWKPGDTPFARFTSGISFPDGRTLRRAAARKRRKAAKKQAVVVCDNH